jgi:hypothetical protein
MATGNISQRRDDDDGHLFHDVDDNPMDTVIALEKSAQILMPMATKEGFKTLFAAMNEQNTKTTL